MIIDPNDYRFTFSEVVGESTVDATNLRNWMARDTVAVGQKHKLGRWLFSIADIVRIRIVKSLGALAGMPPADANKLADIVVQRYHELVDVDDQGQFPVVYLLKPNSLAGRKRLMLTAGQGQPYAQVGSYDKAGVLQFSSVHGSGRAFNELNVDGPYLMIPMDEIIARTVMNYTISALEEEGRDWQSPAFRCAPGDSSFDPFAAMVSIEGMIDWYGRNPPPVKSASQMLQEPEFLKAVVLNVEDAINEK